MWEENEFIRNFAIIAHIDHGKSTLADRFLEVTKTISKDKMVEQYLDRLSLERERGITIKMQPVQMIYQGYKLNLIDTPGHVDFSYEVSRALTAVEGAILLIDGTQGIQAQTIAHLQTAKKIGLTIIPAINKIDLVLYDLPTLINDIKNLINLSSEEEIHLISAKLGTGVEELLQAVIEKIPPPKMRTYADLTQTYADLTQTYADYTETKKNSKLLYQDLSYKIRAAAFSVRKHLGLGHKEIIYKKALEIELQKLGIEFEKEKSFDITYENKKIGNYRPDFIIENQVIVEIKSLPFLSKEQKQQIWHYLKNTSYRLALLINFGGQDIEIERIIFDQARDQTSQKSISSPQESALSPRLSASLIFDSHFDPYKGIIAHIRVFSGRMKANESYILKASNFKFKPVEVGIFKPELERVEELTAGDIGYVATGIKAAGVVKIGDTIVASVDTPALTGYQEPLPVVFASIFPSENITYDYFQSNLDKFRLTDPAIEFTPISSPIFGRGYLVGCLGLLHLEIFQERLKREFGTEIILTLPSVEYEVLLKTGEKLVVKNSQEWPAENKISETREPWAKILLVTPTVYLERVLNLVKQSEGIIKENTRQGSFYLIEAELPIEELITGFYDELKSVSAGYASLEWQFLEYRPANLIKLDILIAEEKNPSLSRIAKYHRAESIGRNILKQLKELLPRQQFAIKLQVAIGSRIIARETIPARQADVTGHLYGGDRTRKVKLWQKQKRGKKKLAQLGRGRVRVPNDVLIKILKIK
jgi:GTP-binding protein LepA